VNLNATLFAQLIVFFILVWFTMKFVWPPITKALDDRAKKIADGLAAAERGKHELELASKRSAEVVREGKEKSADVLANAEKRAVQIIKMPRLRPRLKLIVSWQMLAVKLNKKSFAHVNSFVIRSLRWL